MAEQTFEKKIEGRITVHFSNGRTPQVLYYSDAERRTKYYNWFIHWEGYSHHDIAPGVVKPAKQKRRAARLVYSNKRNRLLQTATA